MAEEEDGKLEELAHYAHKCHLALEGLEGFVHEVEIVNAAKLVRAHMQMAYDLRRMRAALSTLEKLSRRSGRGAAVALERLAKAKAAYSDAELAFNAERGPIAAANEVLRFRKLAGISKEGTAMAKTAQAALKFEEALKVSRIGNGLLKTGRILTSKPFVKGLVVLGGAIEAVASYSDSTAVTTTGKVSNAVLGGGGGALTMLNPWVAVGDLLAPTGYKLSEIYHGGAGAITAIGEGMLKSDSPAMEDFHQRSMHGHYGKVMQAASEAGEFWSEKGISGGLKEFADSVGWWISR